MILEPGFLSNYFRGVISKILTPTEVDLNVSHGHEYQGIKSFIELFGKPQNGETHYIDVQYVYLSDNEDDYRKDKGVLTCYDCRWGKPRAAEYRLYYKDNQVTDVTRPGDLMIMAKMSNNKALAIIAKKDSNICADIRWLFGIEDVNDSTKFSKLDSAIMEHRVVPPYLLGVLEIIGIPLPATGTFLDEMLSLFGNKFPSSSEFSSYARSKSKYPNAKRDDANMVVIDWYSTEEQLYSIFEKHLIDERIQKGFDADALVMYAKSILNRRKSRAGKGLENHLEQIFIDRNIAYCRTPCTEGTSKPDFLFPSIQHYRNMRFPANELHMLGVKTTCKDRWRQVLAEAERIVCKHLFTMQAGISEAQTDEMIRHNLRLVIPATIHSSYTEKQQNWLIDLEEFMDMLKHSQRKYLI